MDILSLILKNSKDIGKLHRQICCIQNGCPAISAFAGNTISCQEDGLYVADSSSSSLTFDNGLSEALNNVKLGGLLTQNTTITSNTYKLILTGSVNGNSL